MNESVSFSVVLMAFCDVLTYLIHRVFQGITNDSDKILVIPRLAVLINTRCKTYNFLQGL